MSPNLNGLLDINARLVDATCIAGGVSAKFELPKALLTVVIVETDNNSAKFELPKALLTVVPDTIDSTEVEVIAILTKLVVVK